MSSHPEIQVYVLQRPLDKVGKYLTFVGAPAEHWGLIVEFKNGDGFYLCEITGNSNNSGIGSLISGSGWPNRRFQKFQSLEDCKEGNSLAKIKNIGASHSTLEQLENFTFEIYDKKKYNLLSNNCQEFVLEFLKRLNIFKHGLTCVKDLVGVWAPLIVLIIGLIILIIVLIIKYISTTTTKLMKTVNHSIDNDSLRTYYKHVGY